MPTTEMFDVLDEQGQKTGEVAPKRDVHFRGLWHAGVHLCVTDGNGTIIQQKRGKSPQVKILPDVWDLFLAAGHVSAGHSELETVLKELNEETGIVISVSELMANGFMKVGVTRSDYWVNDPSFPSGGYHHRAFDHNFVARMPNIDIATLVAEPGKVAGFRRYSVRQLHRDRAQLRSSSAYQQHAVRPPQNDLLYQTVLNGVTALTQR